MFNDHNALQHNNSQGKLNQRHSIWVECLQSYSFGLKHRFGKSNKVADALSMRIALLNTLSIEVVGLECVKELYAKDSNFVAVWKACKEPWSMDITPYLEYHIQEGFLFKNHQLCIPQGSLRLNLVKELHNGGLGGHFGIDETTVLVKERYCWPSINMDVRKFVE